MELGLEGRTVIVTGGSGGLGRRVVRAFADEGADVLITYHQARAEAELLAKEFGDHARAVRFALDDAGSATAVVSAALDWTGRVDVLINNAVLWGGMATDWDRPFETVPDEGWTSTLLVNIEGAVRLTRAVVPVLRERTWGRLVHISSSIATDGMIGGEYYGAAKSALHGFSRSIAFSLGGSGDILSNVVVPGLTRTDTNTDIAAAAGDHFATRAPIARLLDADEVARPIVYLASAANTGITGQAITVTGGA